MASRFYEDQHAPFRHPRRDRYLGRARATAAMALSLLQAAWFVAFVLAIQGGTELTATLSVLGLAGIFFIAGRTGQAADVSLGMIDRMAGMDSAPLPTDILRRLVIGFLLPLGFLWGGFFLRESAPAIYICLAGLLASEAVFRLGGHTVWRSAQIPFPVLKELLRGSPQAAFEVLRGAVPKSARELEASALGISGIAIQRKNTVVLENLEEFLVEEKERRGEGEAMIADRSIAVVRADRARLIDAESSGEEEAEALRQIPAGHPRRLAYGLFVATAALDQEDPESALKALRLLHSRDVVRASGRVLVNWLMLEAAGQKKDLLLQNACKTALKTFDLHRVARAISVEEASGKDDPYSRWILRAREELKKEG